LTESPHETPDIKREQVHQRPDLTHDTRENRGDEAKYGKSIPIVVAIVGVVFVLVIIGAIVATR
jgi:hypothetical protein